MLYIGEPTPRQKAVLIIRSLRLGVDANTRPTTRKPDYIAIAGRPTVAYKTCSDGTKKLPGQTYPTPPPFRRKRQTSINSCPTASRQANNRICPNMCPRGKYCMYMNTMYCGLNFNDQRA